MNTIRRAIPGLLAIGLLSIGAANAALVLAPNGLGVYDSDQDITWLVDANLAATNTFGVAGILTGANAGAMSWSTSQAWTAAMNSANYLGVNTWRLPTTTQPDPNCSLDDGLGNGYGTGCTGSEMGHLYGVDGIRRSAPGPFLHIVAPSYHSSTEYAPTPIYDWLFSFSTGTQNFAGKTDNRYAWAVAPGNPFSAVPVPAAAWLFPSALAVLGLRRRRQA